MSKDKSLSPVESSFRPSCITPVLRANIPLGFVRVRRRRTLRAFQLFDAILRVPQKKKG